MSDNEAPLDLLLGENEEDQQLDELAEEGEILDEILQETTAAVSGPRLMDKVNKVMKAFMVVSEPLKDTPEKIKSVLVPEGSDFLVQTRVNDAIYPLLSAPLKKENSNSLKLENVITKSSIIQADLMQKMFELKKHLPVSQADLVNNMIRDLAKSVEILGFGRAKLNEARRETIVGSLNSEFKSVLTATSPGDGLLFGSSLNDSLKEIDIANKMTARLSRFGDSSNGANNRPQAATSSQARYSGNNGSFLGRGQTLSKKRKAMWTGQRQYGKAPYRGRPTYQRGGEHNPSQR